MKVVIEWGGNDEAAAALPIQTPPTHYGSKLGDIETLDYILSHELGSERSERASEQMSAAERASEASRAEQANE